MPTWAKWALGAAILFCVVCGGGCAALGFFGFREASKISADAGTFAKPAATEILTTWSADQLINNSDPGAFGQDQAATMLNQYKAKYGQFKSLGEFTMTGFNAQNNNGVSSTNIKLSTDASFEKGTSKLVLDLVKRNTGGWKFKTFSLE